MNDETLAKLRKFEADVKAKKTQASRVITELKPIAEDAAEAAEKVVEEVQKVKGWRALFCCK